MSKYTKGSHSIFNLGYHLIFSSKYRKLYLQYYERDLKSIFNDIANEINIVIKDIEFMPDHVHIFFKCINKIYSIPKIVQLLKGKSSYLIRNKYPILHKYKSFWTPSYFIESIGNISEKSIRRYIKNQKK